MMVKNLSEDSLSEGLWDLSSKLKGLGELFGMAQNDQPFSNEGLCGISQLLAQFADDLGEIRDALEHGPEKEIITRQRDKVSDINIEGGEPC